MSKEKYDLHVKMLECDGMKFQNRMKSHSFTLNIFVGNDTELQEGLSIIENPDVAIKLVLDKNRQESMQAHREINRLFHNYLASAKTLIDHTRVFIDEYYVDTVVASNYKVKILDEFANDPLVRFVQDLRNFMLHNGLPHNEMSFSFENGSSTIESQINLDTIKLQQWTRWTKPSKNFLNLQSEKLSLIELIQPYSEKVIELHNWLNSELYRYHEKDLQEFRELQSAYQNFAQNVT
ncbi:hypothetical protein A6E05_19225 [Aliivibrio sp. 1S165]|uniref:hypothetical protein n=1 Tax=unclassified Aliivibrio TaxID=2645654 RepID=UPI00080DC470|nr:MULTISPECIES: hypothetical protein [unclassified Aliivibrio]OCH14326.1 hypothetical protein A6E05_19225 [Aliivibrio sp. 1S165]OCH36191.1 hypothetical protein A6E06_00260 [Aliivibrio sp. 1S175]